MPSWKRMSSGKYIDLSDLKESDISIYDINRSLNHIHRFTGHYDKVPPLTVAQHSLLCLKLAEQAGEDPLTCLCTFTHDFAEAYLGDVSTPLKRIMGQYWKDFSKPIEHMVNDKFSPEGNNPDMEERVKIYDLMALDIERRCMWNQLGKDKWPSVPKDYGTLEEKLRMFHSCSMYNFVDCDYILDKLRRQAYGE